MHEKYIIPLIIFGTLVLVMFVFIVVSFLSIHKQRQRRHIMEKKAIAYKNQVQLLRTRLEVEELALKSISREIHDHVNQILGVVRMNLFHIPKAGSTEEANRYVEETNDMVREAIDHLRDLSHTISGSGIKKMGLVNAIRKELNNFSQHSQLNCQLQSAHDELPLSAEQEILIFRILQEGLVNIVKHANATEVAVVIRFDKGILTIDMHDNGTGFEARDSPSGIGLVNMQERAELLHGKLEVLSFPGEGCTVSLRVDLRHTGNKGFEDGTPENNKDRDHGRPQDC